MGYSIYIYYGSKTEEEPVEDACMLLGIPLSQTNVFMSDSDRRVEQGENPTV